MSERQKKSTKVRHQICVTLNQEERELLVKYRTYREPMATALRRFAMERIQELQRMGEEQEQ